MNYKEITDLIKLINRTDVSEFKIKNKDFELQVRTKHFAGKSSTVNTTPIMQMPMGAPVQAPAAPAPSAAPAPASADIPAPATAKDSAVGLLEIKSPIVGTFYRSSSPDKPPFVKVGDTIEKGGVVCIVEAMKLFNEIESEVSGKIVKVMIEDAQPVEYDQVLFLVDPS